MYNMFNATKYFIGIALKTSRRNPHYKAHFAFSYRFGSGMRQSGTHTAALTSIVSCFSVESVMFCLHALLCLFCLFSFSFLLIPLCFPLPSSCVFVSLCQYCVRLTYFLFVSQTPFTSPLPFPSHLTCFLVLCLCVYSLCLSLHQE